MTDTQTQPTPGNYHRVGYYVAADNESVVADCQPDTGIGVVRAKKEAVANATFLAAAPELYDELRALIQWCEDNFCGEPSGPDLIPAKAAIVKATKFE